MIWPDKRAEGGYRISHELGQITEQNVTRWKPSYYLYIHTKYEDTINIQ